jgi:hypothetical protein
MFFYINSGGENIDFIECRHSNIKALLGQKHREEIILFFVFFRLP